MPLVSIAIPSFNHERFVKACIQSVIAQDYENIELIIIDDGSTDNSCCIIGESLLACRTRFKRFEFRSRPNKGLAATLNEALDWSTGKYFAAIASDDLLLPNKTSLLLANIEHEQDVAGIFSGCEIIDQSGLAIGQLKPSLTYYSHDEVLIKNCHLVAPSQLLRLNLVKQVGGYPIGLYIEDWYMWLSLTKAGYKLKVIPNTLVKYRQHESNISKNVLKMFESRKLILDLFKDHWLYGFAMAKTLVSAAIEFSTINKISSAKYLIEAAKWSIRVILTYSFAVALIRLLLPRFCIKLLSGIRLIVRKRLVV